VLRTEHVMARFVRGRLVPHRLSPQDERAREVAEALVTLYVGHVGKARALLETELSLFEEELGPRLDVRRGFKILRALAKLLEEKATWAPPTGADPYTLRTRLFELAAALPEPPSEKGNLLEGRTREELLSQVSGETWVEEPATVMYADRQGAQLLAEFEPPSPEALIMRYNVAQIQGVLYSAQDLTVDLGAEADARLVFHYVKLLGLIYNLERNARGYRLRLDGPLSLFGSTRKYGLRLAKLIPGLLLTGPWQLHASVSWKGREAILELDSDAQGLTSHYRGPADAGEGDVPEAFVKAWNRAKDKNGWELEPGAVILPIPHLKTALVPDFTFRHAETDEKVHLEILGFWSERHLVERVSLLREAAQRGYRVLIAAPESLGASPETLSTATQGGVIPFKSRLDAKSVLAALRAEDTADVAKA
jgi:predicted nuclease of restriction endonuclease-like RecB superfamily